jgi:hypothetical protein
MILNHSLQAVTLPVSFCTFHDSTLHSPVPQGCGTFKSCDHTGIHLDADNPSERLRNWCVRTERTIPTVHVMLHSWLPIEVHCRSYHHARELAA